MGNSPTWKHDCTKCKFLGQTIGGGKIHDLYVCVNKADASLIARYGNDGPDYYSMPAHLVSPGYAHAELFVAKALYEESLNVPDENTVTASSGCVFCDIGLKPVDGYHKTVTEDVKCPLNSPHQSAV